MFVLASGNLFTGSFNYASFTGTVKFGSKYTYTARPRALRVKYHATTDVIDMVRSQNPAPGVAKGDPDKCRIFVAIVDWAQPHTVVSGMSSTTGAWDPTNGADVVSEGKVVGYGSMWIDQSTPRRCLGLFRGRAQNPLVRRESSGSHRGLHDRDLMRRECLRRLHDGLLQSLPLCR